MHYGVTVEPAREPWQWALGLIRVVPKAPAPQAGAESMPTFCVIRTRSATESACIFFITRPRCTFTVFSAAPSSAAICLLSIPVTTRASTSRSRGVKICQPPLDLAPLGVLRERLAAPRERALDRVEQLLALQRLPEEVQRPALHRPHAHGNIPSSGDEDDGHPMLDRAQRRLQVEPAQPRQPNVEDEACRAVRTPMVEEGLGGGKGLRVQPDRPHEAGEGAPHRLLVVHDVHRFIAGHVRADPFLARQLGAHGETAGGVSGGPETPAMILDDGAADGQAHAEAVAAWC